MTDGVTCQRWALARSVSTPLSTSMSPVVSVLSYRPATLEVVIIDERVLVLTIGLRRASSALNDALFDRCMSKELRLIHFTVADSLSDSRLGRICSIFQA